MTRPRLILLIRCAVLCCAGCAFLSVGFVLTGLSFLLVGLMMPVFAVGGTCLKCTAGTCHTSYQVVITGVVAGSCGSDCTTLNGTFSVTGTCTAGVACQWSVSVAAVCGFSGLLTLQVYRPVTATIALASFDSSTNWIATLDAGGGNVDCGFSSQSLANSPFGSPCDITASTCLVTAL